MTKFNAGDIVAVHGEVVSTDGSDVIVKFPMADRRGSVYLVAHTDVTTVELVKSTPINFFPGDRVTLKTYPANGEIIAVWRDKAWILFDDDVDTGGYPLISGFEDLEYERD